MPVGVSMPFGGTIINARPCGIPWRAVVAWAEHNKLSRQEMALLDYCIVAMDAVYIAKAMQKIKEGMK